MKDGPLIGHGGLCLQDDAAPTGEVSCKRQSDELMAKLAHLSDARDPIPPGRS